MFGLLPSGSNPRSGLQQHLVSPEARDDDEHVRVIRRAAGGVAALDTSARARVAAVAAPGTRGASLAAPTTHTTAAALQGAAALAAAAATAAPAGATVTSTTPPACFDWSRDPRLHEINLDDLRRTTLVSQDDPANTTTARAVHQPLVAGWERAGCTRTSPSLPTAGEGCKYRFSEKNGGRYIVGTKEGGDSHPLKGTTQ